MRIPNASFTQQIQAIRIHSHGGPDVLKAETLQLGPPAAGEIQIQHHAIGLNFIEIYMRTGLYPAQLPACLGTEAAGIVNAVGKDVQDFELGDRVAYASGPIGAYSTARNIGAQHVVKLPDCIGFNTAAAMMLKGLTAQYLLRQVYKVQAGETILFHAAAGGVGSIAVQWAKQLGVRVIGTVSTPEKAALAKSNGCEEVIVSSHENLVDRVKALTDGKGVPVVFDSVGKATFVDSLNCLQARGLMVSFGNASGAVDPMPLSMLAQRGSLMLTRPTLATFTANPAQLRESAAELFEMVGSGKIRIQVNQTYPLTQAGDAQHLLETRQTTGSTVLIPSQVAD